MISTGALIWTSVRPLIRTVCLDKGQPFPYRSCAWRCSVLTGATAGATWWLNIALPCLMFSRIVPSLTPQNIGSLAPLTVIGLFYGIVGVAMAWIIRLFFWVPHRFRYGILAAGGWGNWGDIPTAIAMGITASAPFNGTDDENLAIAYVSVLILVFLITLFPLGGFLLVVKDFEGPDVESAELRERMGLRRYRLAETATISLGRLSRLFRHSNQVCDSEVGKEKDLVSHHEIVERKPSIDRKTISSTPPSPTIVPDGSEGFTPPTSPEILQQDHRNPTNHHHLSRQLHFRCRHFLVQLLKPCPMVIVFAIVIALVDPLKALFLPPSASFQPRFRPIAPDGQPPLAFVLDTANFIGAAMVPLGLVCLGSALACLRVHSGVEAFPRGAIAALALARMVLTPLLGVGITRWFVRVGFVNRDDKVLQFVCILFSGLPTATTQVYLTQIYSPTGSVEHLSAFLIPQYILMPFTLTGLIAYTLNYLF